MIAGLRWFRFDHPFSRRQVIALFCASLALAMAAGVLSALRLPSFASADHLLLDNWLRIGAPAAREPGTVMVDIDDASYKQ